jgi:hypothetical protein
MRPFVLGLATVVLLSGQPPADADLMYDTFCKKEEREKRTLFRAATPAQKSALARTQIERWRDANRAQQSTEQLTVLQELWAMATADMFERTPEGKTKLAAFEARAGSVYPGRILDQLSPFGPCVPKAPIK